MVQQNVSLQIEALNQLKQELEMFAKELDMRAQTYYSRVQALANLDVNFAKTYDAQYWRQDYQMIAALRQHIQLTDIKFVERSINSAESLLSNYQK